ncbi:Heme-binding-like protein, chloroplastic [Mucuna pruriens]|uniref:Heme-binding-like protein, chloroplastic n=1 Tax=Mucuna pruriens TaxID=157652 RepID=A0A371ESA2_MUCPR|nr:Heme-binding-like protein, chloroplastic [Mucuna pruriens]
MATSNLSHQTSRPFPTVCVSIRPPSSAVSLRRQLPPPPKSRKRALKAETTNRFKWAIQLCLVEQSPPKSTFDMQQLVGFLYDDLIHLFDDQGIDKTAYDERVFFRDPITKHDTLSGYLFNIALLKTLFGPQFQLHWVKPTGPYEVTTRWTMVMKFVLLPWKPELVFTGTSVMGVNPENGKFCSHVLRIYKTPELESPKYQVLRRTANYEVRQYDPFIVVETNGDKLSGSTGFNDVAGYIFGKNSTTEKIPMTTPVFTQANDADLSKVSIQIVLPLDKETESLPNPNQETVRLRKVEGGIAAVMKFSGKPTEDIVREKEKTLRSNIIKDGLKPQLGCLLARYNDPGRTWTFIMILCQEHELMRNEGHMRIGV